MEPTAQELILLGKVILGSLLGGIVGLEREFAAKPAGLRTHMLVGATSTFLVLMAVRAVSFFGSSDFLRTDPIRILEAIVVGISFLGAGTILKSARQDEPIEGLTTSASILSVAAVGIAVGFNAFILAAGVTLWNLFVNWGLNYLVQMLKAKTK
jgi:putative Mg2+ transporter-C (MgtC) family protein